MTALLYPEKQTGEWENMQAVATGIRLLVRLREMQRTNELFYTLSLSVKFTNLIMVTADSSNKGKICLFPHACVHSGSVWCVFLLCFVQWSGSAGGVLESKSCWKSTISNLGRSSFQVWQRNDRLASECCRF